MGSPTPLMSVSEIQPPSVADTIRVLSAGKTASKELGDEKGEALVYVLEALRETLLPLVPMLCQPVSKIPEFANAFDVPQPIHKQRAMLVFDGSVSGFSAVALSRNGSWIFPNRDLGNYQQGDSRQFAEFVLKKIEQLIKASERRLVELRDQEAIDTLRFLSLMPILQHRAIMWFLSKCVGVVREQLKKREQRVQRMRRWMDLTESFMTSLDPLQVQDCTVTLPQYYIWEKTEHGTHSASGGYFSQIPLEKIWQHLGGKQEAEKKGYFEYDLSFKVTSLESLLSQCGFVLQEAADTAKRMQQSLTRSDRLGVGIRMPISDSEWKVVEELVKTLYK